LEFDPTKNEIRLDNPHLPPFLDFVVLRNLQLGGSGLNLIVRRHREDVSVEVLGSHGRIQVAVIHSR